MCGNCIGFIVFPPLTDAHTHGTKHHSASSLAEWLSAVEAKQDEERMLWLAYAAFHLGSYKQALDAYQSLLDKGCDDQMLHVYMGCCMERMGWHAEAEERASKVRAARCERSTVVSTLTVRLAISRAPPPHAGPGMPAAKSAALPPRPPHERREQADDASPEAR